MARLHCNLWLLLLCTFALASVGCEPANEIAEDDESYAEGELVFVSAPAEIKDGWGHFTGRFTIAGAPSPEKIEIIKDEAYCGKFMLKNEALIVGKDGGLANVVVMLNLRRGDPLPEPHESYKMSESATIALDNLECRFTPRVVLLRATQTLEVKNSDPEPVAHNAKIEADPPINPTIAPGGSVMAQFRAQDSPAPISCSIHPWMTAKLIVKDSPYMAVTDKNGEFKIENLPSGEWRFQVWHEELGYVRFVNVGGDEIEWERGVIQVVPISDDETTDLGEVKLDFAKYEE
jgi:hypothetical protein